MLEPIRQHSLRPPCRPSDVLCPSRHIFGSGGDTPNILAAAARLAVSAARGSAPPPEAGLLGSLCRDREHRASIVVDRLSSVTSPAGFLTAAKAAKDLRTAAVDANPANYGEGTSSRVARDQRLPARQATTRMLAPLPLRPAVTIAVQLQVGEVRSLLSLESRPLASLSMSGLAFEAHRNEWWERTSVDYSNLGAIAEFVRGKATWVDTRGDAEVRRVPAATDVGRERAMPTGWPGWSLTAGRKATALRYVRVRLQGIRILDLTTDGQLHHEVVSHAEAAGTNTATAATGGTAERGPYSGQTARPYGRGAAAVAAAERLPVVVVEFVPARADGRKDGELNASVRGVRVCYLRRFMAEVIKYFGPDGLGPVMEVARTFAGGEAEVPGSDDDDEEEEKVAVVVGEEDAAVPDDWSVVSSVTNRAGVKRDARETSPGAPLGQQPGDGQGGTATPDVESRDSRVNMNRAMRVTAVLEDLTVVLPRSTHSREAAAVQCEKLVLEVR